MNEWNWMTWNEWIVKWMICKEWIAKSAPIPSLFYDFYVEPSSRYCLATSSSKSGPRPSVFLPFLCEIELSRESRAHFVDLIVQKWSDWDRHFFTVSMSNKSSSRYSLNILLTSSSKSAIKNNSCLRLRFFMEPRAHFCRPHLQRVPKNLSVFLTILCEIELAKVQKIRQFV